MNARSDLGQALALAARTINQSRTLDQTLQAITDAVARSVPGFDQAGVSILRQDGSIVTRASTGDLVERLDRIQYSLGEGPCVDTLRDSDVVTAPNLRHDQRWPRFVPEASRLGVRSQLALRLSLDDEGTLGGLNLYSTTSEELDPEAAPAAELFAAHAAVALGHAREREQFDEALCSRKVIGQALGILMERHQIDEERAFAFLVRVSSQTNTKLREVARELVSRCNRRPA